MMYNGKKQGGVMILGVEYELKFRATPAQLDALEKGIQAQSIQIRMETTYYDTPTGALSGRRYTLRRRMENGRSVCTFKYPVSGPGRGEAEVESDSLENAIPALCKLSDRPELAVLTAEGLVEVCGARFTRRAYTVSFRESTLEVALDRGVLLGGGREIPLWEAEVELKTGTPADAQAYAGILAGAYGLQPEQKSKFRRALDLAQGE